MKRKTKKVTAHDNIKIPVKDETESKHVVPLTGADVAQMFTEKRHTGKWEQYFLKEMDGDTYRYTKNTLPSSYTKNVPALGCTWFHQN